ncbi:MLKL and TUDOR domains-containing protein [Podospora pseudoanserina]|uniref:MLKL and TUDOR domains-containing protein n=1 Tax=Podospora pseudoanserina TaxID=2609844 RepID=A0ABR0I562_9PEZI|nr:MLKL and TUDOR domains-containing protein [Podospora pseudoanserina]
MSAMDIVSTVTILINLGLEIKNRLDSLNQAAEELQLLTTNLTLLLKVFESPLNEDIFKTNASQFVPILDVLESIARSCRECAKALDIDLAGATIATKTESRGRKFVKRIWAFSKISDLLAEIERKAEQLQQVYSVVFTVILQDIRVRQGRTSGKETVEFAVVQTPTIHEHLLDLDLSTDFANIDRMVGSLMKECEYLRQRLQEATLSPDTSVVQEYQAQNPEAASFWKDRFQKDELNASTLRYETLYVSWARFVHEIEASFVLKKIPTGIFETGNIDLVHQRGSRYGIDQSGTRRLSSIRPLWLPALRSALDPLHKGYVKPHDYFNLLRDSSLSDSLRRLALENAGYGTLVECERESGDLPLPAAIESPSDHVGWISAQIVAVPTPDELGIVTEREIVKSSSDALFAYFNDTAQDVHVYVRYLQTGQIERKSLSKRVRPIAGISLGAALSIRHELESGDHAWSGDLHITEFKACYGERYIITAGVGSTAIVFFTRPLKNFFDKMLRDDDNPSGSTIPEFECTLLGPSKVFTHPPKVGEKVQIEYDGLWYDSKVTEVDGEEIEYINWDSAPEQVPSDIIESQDDSQGDEEDSGSLFFPEKQLTQLGKGTRRLWRPWRRDLQRYDVRPYRCFHIGDSIEAPVMYPDFRYHYHVTDNSELYLPARIVDVQGDQYVIEFSPALSVHRWWPGRMPKGERIDLVPGSGIKAENPFDFNRVTVGMDRIRPFSAGPRPVLGVQSAKPSGWSSFQGVRLSNLEDLLEHSLWNDNSDS